MHAMQLQLGRVAPHMGEAPHDILHCDPKGLAQWDSVQRKLDELRVCRALFVYHAEELVGIMGLHSCACTAFQGLRDATWNLPVITPHSIAGSV